MNKPPYKVPDMANIGDIKQNGLKVASTFSGTGGSCLGYRLAGFDVVWANEFIPIAQESYKANFHSTHLDGRDIKLVKAQDVFNATGLKEGELDLFDGSPPCQAFSTAGKREANWGKGKTYENGVKQNNEDLFFEYVRLLEGLKPKVFVAENVSGLVKGTAKGYFLEILKRLKACGYNVEAKLLDAQWLGVPQSRQRIIFIGVRDDLGLSPCFPKPLPYRYSVKDALPHIESVHKMYTNHTHGYSAKNQPSTSITTQGFDGTSTKKVMTTDGKERKFTIDELKRICSFPDDFILKGTYDQQWERLGNSVPPVMMYHIATAIYNGIFNDQT